MYRFAKLYKVTFFSLSLFNGGINYVNRPPLSLHRCVFCPRGVIMPRPQMFGLKVLMKIRSDINPVQGSGGGSGSPVHLKIAPLFVYSMAW